MNFIITDGNTHDCTQAENLIQSVIHERVYVLGDRAYDAEKIVEYITRKSAIAVIPPRKNRKVQRDYDKKIYKNRNQIERFLQIKTIQAYCHKIRQASFFFFGFGSTCCHSYYLTYISPYCLGLPPNYFYTATR